MNKYFKGAISVYSTPIYHYTPKQIVMTIHGNSSRGYKIVYSKNLKLHKGVDNKIQFQLLNQEQKPIDITNKELTFRLLSDNGKSILIQKSLTNTLALNGIAVLEVVRGEIESINSQICTYSIEINDGSMNLPVFVSSDAGARGVVEVVNSILPNFQSSDSITIPSSQSRPVGNASATYYSSVLTNSKNSTVTFQTYLSAYTGTVQIQGSTIQDADWYDIDNPDAYMSSTKTTGHTINGFHPYLRVKFTSTAGDITKILVR
jgi:hypothetical protein